MVTEYILEVVAIGYMWTLQMVAMITEYIRNGCYSYRNTLEMVAIGYRGAFNYKWLRSIY